MVVMGTRRRTTGALAAAIGTLLMAGIAAAAAGPGVRSHGPRAVRVSPPANAAAIETRDATAPATAPTTVTTAVPATTSTTEPAPIGPVALTGCPPPPHRPSSGGTPWHPAVLVPDAALPPPAPPAARTASLDAIDGKGVWIWKYRMSEGGDTAALVARAARTGLRQLWVRVGDSKDGFYGAGVLNDLVPAAHAAGIRVMAWGFPYLYDPAGDAAWTNAVLAWRSRDGSGVDGFSPDIETASEGTALSARRAVLYLSLVRPGAAASGRPLVATVFPPTDAQLASYPFAAMAAYVDAFAPMVYWNCREPGDAAASAIARLSPLAPVHVIGQGYDMGPEGGRIGPPSGQEILRFFDVARRSGARGASLWDWQEMTADHWSAVAGAFWPLPVR